MGLPPALDAPAEIFSLPYSVMGCLRRLRGRVRISDSSPWLCTAFFFLLALPVPVTVTQDEGDATGSRDESPAHLAASTPKGTAGRLERMQSVPTPSAWAGGMPGAGLVTSLAGCLRSHVSAAPCLGPGRPAGGPDLLGRIRADQKSRTGGGRVTPRREGRRLAGGRRQARGCPPPEPAQGWKQKCVCGGSTAGASTWKRTQGSVRSSRIRPKVGPKPGRVHPTEPRSGARNLVVPRPSWPCARITRFGYAAAGPSGRMQPLERIVGAGGPRSGRCVGSDVAGAGTCEVRPSQWPP